MRVIDHYYTSTWDAATGGFIPSQVYLMDNGGKIVVDNASRIVHTKDTVRLDPSSDEAREMNEAMDIYLALQETSEGEPNVEA